MTISRREGTVQYSGRAFHQDATDAMRGDIVRGLIELITNSDDAYAALDDDRCGKIVIEVEHRRGSQPWKVVVKDRALGMSAETMVQHLTQLGGRTSGFESGQDRRGNLGRGAKDLAAFGDVTFSSIHEGRFSQLILRADSSWQLLAEREAITSDREQLGVPRGNGTVVVVQVEESIRCPRHDTLKRKLATHFQLRDILSDPLRRVELVNLNDGSRDRLTYEHSDLPVVFEGELDIPGYEGVKAELIIWRQPSRYDEGPNDTGRPNGILIKGQRAIYDNTLFKFENEVHAGWFSGKLTCRHIDQLAREYDDRLEEDRPPDPTNPVPIISRRRDGLNSNHPFVAALKEAVEGPLGELVAEEAECARRGGNIESEETRAALDRLAREVSRLINEEMQEIEADELPTDLGAGEPPLITIVPGEAYAYMGEDRTLTVAVRNEGVAVGDEVNVEVDPGGVVELLTPTVSLNAHTRREDILVGQIRLRPLLSGEVTMVAARMQDRNGEALVEVKPARDIIEEEIVPPETLEFERPSYRVGWQRKKELTIAAPTELVAEHGQHVRVSSSDSGVVIRTPTVELEYDDSVEFYRASVQIEARNLNAKGVVTARLEEIAATTHVAVTRKEESPSFRVRLVDQEWGSFRAIIESEPLETGGEIQIIRIAGRHPAIKPYLGEGLEGQNTPVCRTLMAEAAADVAARYVVTKLYQLRRTIEPFDSERIYREHYKRVIPNPVE